MGHTLLFSICGLGLTFCRSAAAVAAAVIWSLQFLRGSTILWHLLLGNMRRAVFVSRRLFQPLGLVPAVSPATVLCDDKLNKRHYLVENKETNAFGKQGQKLFLLKLCSRHLLTNMVESLSRCLHFKLCCSPKVLAKTARETFLRERMEKPRRRAICLKTVGDPIKNEVLCRNTIALLAAGHFANISLTFWTFYILLLGQLFEKNREMKEMIFKKVNKYWTLTIFFLHMSIFMQKFLHSNFESERTRDEKIEKGNGVL